MNSSWLYRQDSIWIVLALVVGMVLAGELGCLLGRRWHPRTDEARLGHIRAILGSVLGLLALLLSFTFAMSANRYDLRRQLVVNDANSLERLYLLSSLLPEESRKPFKQSLRKYVNLRSRIAQLRHDLSPEGVSELTAEVEALHGDDSAKGLGEIDQLDAGQGYLRTMPKLKPRARCRRMMRPMIINGTVMPTASAAWRP